MPDQSAVATFLLAVHTGGSVLGFSSDDNPQGEAMLRASAACANGTASLVRVDMPLPPGSGSATVTVIDS